MIRIVIKLNTIQYSFVFVTVSSLFFISLLKLLSIQFFFSKNEEFIFEQISIRKKSFCHGALLFFRHIIFSPTILSNITSSQPCII